MKLRHLSGRKPEPREGGRYVQRPMTKNSKLLTQRQMGIWDGDIGELIPEMERGRRDAMGRKIPQAFHPETIGR